MNYIYFKINHENFLRENPKCLLWRRIDEHIEVFYNNQWCGAFGTFKTICEDYGRENIITITPKQAEAELFIKLL